MQSDNPIPLPTDADAVSANVLPFYGNKGKRAAVELFLSRLCATGRSHTLLLYSDEDMSWLYEDAAFRSRWAALLVRILTLGGSIKMIHTVSRNATDSFEREFWNYYALCRPLMHASPRVKRSSSCCISPTPRCLKADASRFRCARWWDYRSCPMTPACSSSTLRRYSGCCKIMSGTPSCSPIRSPLS